MLKAQVIGVGAAGNKAAIKLLEDKVVGNDDILLVNSTDKDVPEDYLKFYQQIGDAKMSLGGCGKEPNIAKGICLQALQDGSLDLEKFIKPDTNVVIITCSTEGGTGCGASPIIAKYLREVLGINVHVFAFLGFEEDARGLLNTVNFFKEIPEDVTVEAIRNKNFLDGRRTSYLTAEERADHEFSVRISILLGNLIIPSTQNMDDTDLFKVSTQTGYMNIEYHEFDETIKNIDHFNEIVTSMIDNTKSLRPDEKSAKLLGVMINIPKKDEGSIDYSCKAITDKYGKPFEKFMHVQSNDEITPFIAFIVSGMDLPLDEVKGVYERYIEATTSVHKSKDDFFKSLGSLNRDTSDEAFDISNKKAETSSKDSFFAGFSMQSPNRTKEATTKSSKKNIEENY